MLTLRGGLVTVGLTLAVTACGESTSNGSDDEESGGDSGSTSGGTSGTGGNAGGGIQGGTSGVASGGDSAGTSSGTGGSTSGGAGAGGASGSSTGGTSGGGAAGGGTAGRGYRPPDNQRMGCTRLCELERDAMCPAETTFEKCVEDCHLGILFEVCSALADEVFACVGAVESAECSASGRAVIPACAADGSALNGCIMTDGLTGTLDAPCASFCTASAAPMCPNTDYESCSLWCQVVSSAFPVCAPTFQIFLECGAGAEQVCNADGEAEATDCAGAFEAFLDCLDADYAWQPGLGIVR